MHAADGTRLAAVVEEARGTVAPHHPNCCASCAHTREIMGALFACLIENG